jgi:hypothetical protein
MDLGRDGAVIGIYPPYRDLFYFEPSLAARQMKYSCRLNRTKMERNGCTRSSVRNRMLMPLKAFVGSAYRNPQLKERSGAMTPWMPTRLSQGVFL